MFESLYLQAFSVAAYQSVDARGDVTYAAPVEYPCRYEPSSRLIRTADGSQEVSSAVLYTSQPVSVRDTIYPPGADPTDLNDGHRPLRVDTHYDPLTGAVAFYAITI